MKEVIRYQSADYHRLRLNGQLCPRCRLRVGRFLVDGVHVLLCSFCAKRAEKEGA